MRGGGLYLDKISRITRWHRIFLGGGEVLGGGNGGLLFRGKGSTAAPPPRNLESMEVLCEMLNSVGKKLDRQQARASMDSYFRSGGRLGGYVGTIAGIQQIKHPTYFTSVW